MRFSVILIASVLSACGWIEPQDRWRSEMVTPANGVVFSYAVSHGERRATFHRELIGKNEVEISIESTANKVYGDLPVRHAIPLGADYITMEVIGEDGLSIVSFIPAFIVDRDEAVVTRLRFSNIAAIRASRIRFHIEDVNQDGRRDDFELVVSLTKLLSED